MSRKGLLNNASTYETFAKKGQREQDAKQQKLEQMKKFR